MNKKFLSILSALLLSIAALSLIPVPSPAQPCVVLSARDGDSLLVRQPDGRAVAVRLYGVDCPELGQPYGDAARDLTGAAGGADDRGAAYGRQKLGACGGSDSAARRRDVAGGVDQCRSGVG